MWRRIVVSIAALVLALVFAAFWLLRDGIEQVSPMTPGEGVAQVAALQTKIGAPLRLVGLDFSADGTRVEVQNTARPEVSDTWKVWHLRLRRAPWIDWMHVGGPEPVTARAASLPVNTLAFAPDQVDVAAVPTLAAAAVQRVALEEPAQVSGMHLGKRWTLLPHERVGDLEWRLEIRSAHETATAYADPAGHITGINLDGTLRAKRVNLYDGGPLLRSFADQLAATFQRKEQIRRLLIYANFLQAEIPDPQQAGRLASYHSNLNGAFRWLAGGTMPDLATIGGDGLFTTAEVDWGALPKLVQTARERLGLPAAPVDLVTIRKRAHGLGQPAIEWEVSFTDGAGGSPSVAMDTGGRVLMQYSVHGALHRNMLEPSAVADFVAQLRRELDPQTAVIELGLRPERATVVVRDAHDPSRVTELEFTGYGLEKSMMPPGRPGTWMGMRFDEGWFFKLQALDDGVLAALPQLQSAALERMQMPSGRIENVALGRHALILDGNRQLAVEVNANDGAGTSRRIYLDLRGRVLRID